MGNPHDVAAHETVDLGNRRVGTLYKPADGVPVSPVAVVTNYVALMQGMELAKRGYLTLAMPDRQNAVANPDELFRDISDAVSYMKRYPGVEKAVGLSWSGGCTTLSAYQAIAEHGVAVFKTDGMLIPCSDIGELTPADGVIFLDSNWGNGAMTLFSLDPAVPETGGLPLDPELDMYNPANGFDPNGSRYGDDFIRKFQKAQAGRMNRLIDRALERVAAIDAGKGHYIDDEPLVIPGGAQFAPYNKLFPHDVRLLSHTKEAYALLHADGTETREVIHTARLPRGGRNASGYYKQTARVTSVKDFLKTCAIRAAAEFSYSQDAVTGLEWDTCYTCTTGNVKRVSCPALVMGMTGNYEFLAAEEIYRRLASADKTIAFVEGANHDFTPNKAAEKTQGQFGDTVKTVFDYVDRWLRGRG
ncbi:MAG: alpha/beta hydrolase [Clostridiales bacterium]|jgi:hypothetical protein|nr:alpha/beta hydrolase [Clostridiales bacterium]